MRSQPLRKSDSARVSLLADEVCAAATRYQTARESEARHLALMAQHNLLADWSLETQRTVLAAREQIQQARAARRDFRRHVREFVNGLRIERQTLPSVLRQTRAMLHDLQQSGAIRDDGGWLEAEILEWAIEEYEAAAA